MNDSANKKAELYFHANNILIRERNELERENIALKAENARLREALERILDDVTFMIESGHIPDVRDDVIYIAARATLEAKP
jgi:hypothetical protein